MNARAVLREATDRGVSIRRNGEALRLRGPIDVIEDIRPRVAAMKAEIMEILAEDHPQIAPLQQARAIVAATTAEELGKASAAGYLCTRCHRIGRIYSNGVCTFCIDETA